MAGDNNGVFCAIWTAQQRVDIQPSSLRGAVLAIRRWFAILKKAYDLE